MRPVRKCDAACPCDHVRLVAEPLTTPENTELPLVWSRTLIGGRFLPSCSQPCREQLQAKIGDYAAKRAA